MNKYSSYPDVKVTISRNDVRLQNQFIDFDGTESLKASDNVKALSLMDQSSGEFASPEGNSYIRDIPLKYEVVRVYVPEKAARGASEKDSGSLQQGELFSESAALPDEGELRDDLTSM